MKKVKNDQSYVEAEKAALGAMYAEYELKKAECAVLGKGVGAFYTVRLYTVYGYDAFSKKGNKKIFVEILQVMSEKGKNNASKLIAYSVYEGGATVLIKAMNRACAEAFVQYAVKNFTEQYNKGRKNVGVPFRSDFDVKEVALQNLASEIRYIHSIVPAEKDSISYAYNSYAYLMQGDTDANLILIMELEIRSKQQFKEMIVDYGKGVPAKKGLENPKKVLSDLKKNEIGYMACFPEKKVDFMLGETAARTGKPYGKIAKMFLLHKRYDIMLSTVCDFIMRRNCSYGEAVYALKLPDTVKLRIEVLAEINRVYHYAYEYIMQNILQMEDVGYEMITELFIALHERYGYTFEQLAVRFHIVREILPIRTKCNF